jgi:dTDP-D-glucose 4,6-dehydratase
MVWDTSRPNGQPRRSLDVSRAEREFGFRAKTDFREGLRRTIDFFRTNREWVLTDERRRRDQEERANARALVR